MDPLGDAKLRKWLRFGFLLAVVLTIVSSLNYSFLLLARTPRFEEEVRLKKALGAGTGRLATELMIGPAVIVVAGLLAACLLWASGLVLVSRASPFYGQLVGGSWMRALLAFGLQVPLACALTLVIAVIPTLGLLRDDGAAHMGSTSTATRRTGFVLQTLVALQITFCVATWILAGMTVSAVASLAREPLGYDPSHLTVVCIRPAFGTVQFTIGPNRSFPTASAIESLTERVSAVPGVRSASFATDAAFADPMPTITLQPAGSPSTMQRTVYNVVVSPAYFRTMGTRIVAGRDFSPPSSAGRELEIVINETLAREFWRDDNPLSRTVNLTSAAFAGIPSSTSVATIVGAAEDMRLSGFTTFLLVTVVTAVGAVAFMAPASGRADGEAAPIFVTKIPPGYRDWRLMSVAHEEGELNDIRAILGNDTAIKSYREEKLPT
jgi:putative ABC transport system permease protein